MLLAAAGTLAAVMAAEWPTAQSAPRGLVVSTTSGVPAGRDDGSLALRGAPAGSAESGSHRSVGAVGTALAGGPGPRAVREPEAAVPARAEPPAASFFGAADHARPTTLLLLPGLTATTSRAAPDEREAGEVFAANGDNPADEPGQYDLTVRLDARSLLPAAWPVGFGVATGLRAMSLLERGSLEGAFTPPRPLGGDDAWLRLGPNSLVRARAAGETPGVTPDFLDLRLEQVWNIGAGTSISVGFRRLRGIVSNELPEPLVKQDAILLELKLGF